MKKLITLAILFIAYNSNAQVTKNLGDFDKVTAFDKITVQLVAADENKIVLKGK
jgi:hypothetical protein